MFKFKKIFMVGLIFGLTFSSTVLATKDLNPYPEKNQNVSVSNENVNENLNNNMNNMKILNNIKYIDFSNAKEEMPKAIKMRKQLLTIINGEVNTFFSNNKDNDNLLAKSLFLHYVYDELIKELKKDEELKNHLEKNLDKPFQDDVNAREEFLAYSGLYRGETAEDSLRKDLNDTLFAKHVENLSFKNIVLRGPAKIIQKIDEVFKTSEHMKKVLSEKNLTDEKFEEIKNSAISFLEKELKKCEDMLSDNAFVEKRTKDQFKDHIYNLSRIFVNAKNIQAFKDSLLDDKKYVENVASTISNERIKSKLNDVVAKKESIVNDEKVLQKQYELTKRNVNDDIKHALFMISNDCERLKQDIAKEIPYYKEAIKREIEIIKSNIDKVKSISKNDLEKIFNQFETKETGEIFNSIEAYAD